MHQGLHVDKPQPAHIIQLSTTHINNTYCAMRTTRHCASSKVHAGSIQMFLKHRLQYDWCCPLQTAVLLGHPLILYTGSIQNCMNDSVSISGTDFLFVL